MYNNNVVEFDADDINSKSLTHFAKNIEDRNRNSYGVWKDYYAGAGRQWMLKGQITRSGTWIVDKLDNDPLLGSDSNNYSPITGGGYESSYDMAKFYGKLNQLNRKRRWAEANIIDFAIDELSRTVKGNGGLTFEIPESEKLSEEFNAFWKKSYGDFEVIDITATSNVYGEAPVFVGEDEITLLDPFQVGFFGSEKDMDSFGAIITKRQTATQIIRFFEKNFGLSPQLSGSHLLYQEIYTSMDVIYAVAGEELHRISHNLGISPVQRFKTRKGSQVREDIPYQDSINTILTETSEVFKANLNPAVVINDDGAAGVGRKKSKKGEEFNIERGPASVIITGKEGSVDYIQWDGLPGGTIETLRVYERHFYNKRGISLFSEGEGKVAESGEAKKEARRTLFSLAQDFRDGMVISFNNIAEVWLAYKGFESSFLEVTFSPMVEMSDTDKANLEQTHWTVHRDTKTYLERIGTFTEENINEIVAEQKKLEDQEIIT